MNIYVRQKRGIKVPIITTDNSNKYEIIEKIGKGGFGVVWKVKRVSDGTIFAFKFFEESDDVKMKLAHNQIRRNIDNLIKRPIKYSDGSYLKGFVRPIEMVSNAAGKKGFGYIMDYVEVKKYATIYKAWKRHDVYGPDALETCALCKAIAHVFDKIHASGRGYKDISEGNLCFEPSTGRIFVMDCDNVAAGNVKTVFGTPKYVAPEVYETEYPNSISDRYSMSVFFYRLLVGGYPLEGQKTVSYMMKNGVSDDVIAVAKKLYSEEALFAFDEKDQSNRIVNITDPSIHQDDIETWKIQAHCWNILPDKIKALFQRVFSENLKGDAKDRRPTENQWIDAFDDVIQNSLVKCKCGKHNFVGSGYCSFCQKKLPAPPPPKKVIPENAVKYKVVSGKGGKEIFTDKLDGSDVSSVFNKDQIILESVLYSANKKMMKIKNKSGFRIDLVHPTGTKAYCVNSASAFLMLGTEIEIDTGKSNIRLKVTDFNVKKH